MDSEETRRFIESSRHALDHLFSAIEEYNKVLEVAQKDAEAIEYSKQKLSDLWMYRNQWSPNANHHYALYMLRVAKLEEQQGQSQEELAIRLRRALRSIGATVESMSNLAGAVLQIAKQVLSLRYSDRPKLASERKIGTQPITEVIWEGRNHAMHWDEGAPHKRVQEMLDALSNDLGITIEAGGNNCLSILGALNWSSAEAVLDDLNALI